MIELEACLLVALMVTAITFQGVWWIFGGASAVVKTFGRGGWRFLILWAFWTEAFLIFT